MSGVLCRKKDWAPAILNGSSLCLSVLMAQTTYAATMIGGNQTIGVGSPVEQWDLSQNATLTINGAQTLGIVANQSALNANNAITQSVSISQNSIMNLISTSVNGGNARAGVEVVNSIASISGGSSISSNRLGLQIAREVSVASGSTVTVTDSRVTGTTGGARATAFSSLALNNASVEGTGTGSFGLTLLSASASMSNASRVTGAQNGIILGLEGVGMPASHLQLDGSAVQGVSGSAIVVDYRGLSAATSTIDVLNGSTLTAGNNVILDVRGSGAAVMNVHGSGLAGDVQVSRDSVAVLNFDQSSMVGDVSAEAGSAVNVSLQNGSLLTGQMNNVVSANIGSHSAWNMTGNNQLGELALAGGTVRFGAVDAFYQLNVQNLSGNGLFEMGTDFATGQTDFLNITGTATGAHQLLIASSGNEPASGQPIQVVHTGGGDANFSLANAQGEVDLGAFSYGLTPGENGADWFLDPIARSVSPSTRAVTALFNTAPTVWYGELTSLRSRMGELRLNQEKSGAWLRAYGSKYNVSDAFGGGYGQTQQGFSLGADAPLDVGAGQLLVGVMAGHSASDLNLHDGTSGTINSYYVGSYLTWMDDASGYYVDGVVKLNRFRNDAKVGMSDGTRSKGDYDNSAIGGSIEVGRNIKLDDGYFIEPFTQWSAVTIAGKNYRLDNDLHAKGDVTRSFLGKVGMTAGRTLHLDDGTDVQPYIRGAFAHEFSTNNEVRINNNVFNNDLSGSRAELGAGVAISLSSRWQAHAEVEYMNGKSIEMPIGGTVGIQYKW